MLKSDLGKRVIELEAQVKILIEALGNQDSKGFEIRYVPERSTTTPPDPNPWGINRIWCGPVQTDINLGDVDGMMNEIPFPIPIYNYSQDTKIAPYR